MSPPSDHGSRFSVSSDDIVRWEEEARMEDAKAAEATQRAALLRLRAQKTRELEALIMGEPARGLESAPPQPPPEVPEAPAPTAPATAAYRKGSWREALRNWVYASAAGLSASELRQLINADPHYGPKFAESDKGYYHALTRLKGDSVITLHGGRYYSPKAFADHVAAVERGEVKDAPAQVYRSSAMGDAILDLIQARPGISGGEIVKVLRSDEEFADSLKYNSGAYNVLARLVKRGQAANIEGGYAPGPKMPARDPASKWSQIGAHLAGATANTQQGEFTLN